MPTLSEAIEKTQRLLEQEIKNLLPPLDSAPERSLEAPLLDAMHYICLGGGKRLRAFLALESAHLFGVPQEQALRVAAAIEMVHAYSLTHDDLPCMDNATLRRGKPSAHIQFNEATALLAGDALQALAFEILAHPTTHNDAEVRNRLVLEFAQALGASGMCGGQMMDISAENKSIQMENVIRLERHKTGAILAYSARSGGTLAQTTQANLHALDAFAHDFGIIFQITDDLLDVEGTVEEVGKTVGADAVMGKANIITLLGKETALEHAQMLCNQAISHLKPFGEDAHLLADLTRYLLKRRA